MRVAEKYGVVKSFDNKESRVSDVSVRVTVAGNEVAGRKIEIESAEKRENSDSLSTPLTLNRAIELAIVNNYSLMAKEYDLKVADQTIRQALTYTGPRVRIQNYQTFLGHAANLGGNSIGDDNINISKLVIQQAFYTFGKAESALELAKHDKALKGVILEMGKQDLILQTINGYSNVLKASKGVAVAEENVRVFNEHLSLVTAQFNSGMVLETDVLMTKVRLLESRQKLIEARNARDLSVKYLCNLLVIPVTRPFIVEDLPEITDLTPAHEGIFATAEENLPELRQMKKVVDLNREQVRLQLKMKNPDINIQGSWDTGSQFNETDDNWSATVVFDALVFDCGNLNRDIRKARLNLEKSRRLLEDARQNVRFGIDAAYQKVEETHDQMNLAMEIIKTSELTAEKTRFQYKNGTTINTDVLNAELALSGAKFGFNNSRYDFIASQASLFRSAGLTEVFVQLLQDEHNRDEKSEKSEKSEKTVKTVEVLD